VFILIARAVDEKLLTDAIAGIYHSFK